MSLVTCCFVFRSSLSFRSFMPSPGTLRHLTTPSLSDTVRVDTGVRQGHRWEGKGGKRDGRREKEGMGELDELVFVPIVGDEVTAYYDPMIAKLVVWSRDRKTALRKLSSSLQQYQVRVAMHLNACQWAMDFTLLCPLTVHFSPLINRLLALRRMLIF